MRFEPACRCRPTYPAKLYAPVSTDAKQQSMRRFRVGQSEAAAPDERPAGLHWGSLPGSHAEPLKPLQDHKSRQHNQQPANLAKSRG